MHISITKGQDRDWVKVKRPNGREESSPFPKKGNLPHDAVHYYVETCLAMERGFWGMVNDGLAIADIQEKAKAAGHASAKRAQEPDHAIVQLIQAERLVECFEAALWCGALDVGMLRASLIAACAQSHVPCPACSDAQIAEIYDALIAFSAHWQTLTVGETTNLTWQITAL